MNVTVFPFRGKPDGTGKKRLLSDLLSDRPSPPFRYNDVLNPRPLRAPPPARTGGCSWSSRRPTPGSAAPGSRRRISTLPQFVQKLGLLLKGPRLIDENKQAGAPGRHRQGMHCGETLLSERSPASLGSVPFFSSCRHGRGAFPRRDHPGPGLPPRAGGTDLSDKTQVGLLIEARTVSTRGPSRTGGLPILRGCSSPWPSASIPPGSRPIPASSLTAIHDADAAGMAAPPEHDRRRELRSSWWKLLPRTLSGRREKNIP